MVGAKVVQVADGIRHTPLPPLQHGDPIREMGATSTHTPVLGGFVGGGQLAWRANGPTVEVIEPSTGQRIAAWTFGALMHNTGAQVTCVCGVGLRHVSQVAVGVDLGVDRRPRGMVALLSLYTSQITRAFHLPYKVTSLCMVSGGEMSVDSGTLAPELRPWQGLLVAGTWHGTLHLLDLALDLGGNKVLSNEISPGNLVKTVSPDPQAERTRSNTVKQNGHLTMCLSSGMSQNGRFQLLGPDERVLYETSSHQVAITALAFIPQLASLVVGYNFGAFQIINVSTLTIDCTSPYEDNMPPVLAFACQEPENDPKNFVYLWLCRSWGSSGVGIEYDRSSAAASSPALSTMYAMNYDTKVWIEGHGLWYQGLASISPRFEFEAIGGLGLTGQPAKPSTIFSAMTVRQTTHNSSSTHGGSTPISALATPDEDSGPVPEQSLCIFGWIGGSLEEGRIIVNHYLAVFDINQWYQAQMPSILKLDENFLCPYMGFHILDRVPGSNGEESSGEIILGATPRPSSWARHMSRPSNEKDWFPAALSYNCYVLTSESLMEYRCQSAQLATLNYLTLCGPSAIVTPEEAYALCIFAGLIQNDGHPTANGSSMMVEREALLNVSLDQHLMSLLVQCVAEFSDGRFTNFGCSLPTLLEWAWSRVRSIKDLNDGLIMPLFDPDCGIMSLEDIATLHQNLTRLVSLTTIITAIRDGATTNMITSLGWKELEGRVQVVELLSLHLSVVLWFYHCGLLSHSPTHDIDDCHVPFPTEVLVQIYKNRRLEIKRLSSGLTGNEVLMIDELMEETVGGAGKTIGNTWEREGEGCMYPPPSLFALLSIFLLPDVTTATKHRIIQYLFLDLASLLSDGYVRVVEELVKYPSSFSLSPSLIKITQAFWLLDHKDFEESLGVFLDPLVNSKDITPSQHRRIMKAFLYQGENGRALRYAEIRQPPKVDIDDIRLHLTLLLANGLVREAFHYQRTHRVKSNTQDLLNHFFTGCEQMGKLEFVIQLPLSTLEEEILVSYLRNSSKSTSLDYLLIYYLQRSRYEDAFMLKDVFIGNAVTDRKRHDARSALIQAYHTRLPEVSRKLTQSGPSWQGPSRTMYSKPQPLSAQIRRVAHSPKSHMSKMMSRNQESGLAKNESSAPYTPFRSAIERRKAHDAARIVDAVSVFPPKKKELARDASSVVIPTRLSTNQDDSITGLFSPTLKRSIETSIMNEDTSQLMQSVLKKSLYVASDGNTSTHKNITSDLLSLLQTPKIHHKKKIAATPSADTSLNDTPQSILKKDRVLEIVRRPASPSVIIDSPIPVFPNINGRKASFSEEALPGRVSDAAMTPKQIRFDLPKSSVTDEENNSKGSKEEVSVSSDDVGMTSVYYECNDEEPDELVDVESKDDMQNYPTAAPAEEETSEEADAEEKAEMEDGNNMDVEEIYSKQDSPTKNICDKKLQILRNPDSGIASPRQPLPGFAVATSMVNQSDDAEEVPDVTPTVDVYGGKGDINNAEVDEDNIDDKDNGFVDDDSNISRDDIEYQESEGEEENITEGSKLSEDEEDEDSKELYGHETSREVGGASDDSTDFYGHETSKEVEEIPSGDETADDDGDDKQIENDVVHDVAYDGIANKENVEEVTSVERESDKEDSSSLETDGEPIREISDEVKCQYSRVSIERREIIIKEVNEMIYSETDTEGQETDTEIRKEEGSEDSVNENESMDEEEHQEEEMNVEESDGISKTVQIQHECLTETVLQSKDALITVCDEVIDEDTNEEKSTTDTPREFDTKQGGSAVEEELNRDESSQSDTRERMQSTAHTKLETVDEGEFTQTEAKEYDEYNELENKLHTDESENIAPLAVCESEESKTVEPSPPRAAVEEIVNQEDQEKKSEKKPDVVENDNDLAAVECIPLEVSMEDLNNSINGSHELSAGEEDMIEEAISESEELTLELDKSDNFGTLRFSDSDSNSETAKEKTEKEQIPKSEERGRPLTEDSVEINEKESKDTGTYVSFLDKENRIESPAPKGTEADGSNSVTFKGNATVDTQCFEESEDKMDIHPEVDINSHLEENLDTAAQRQGLRAVEAIEQTVADTKEEESVPQEEQKLLEQAPPVASSTDETVSEMAEVFSPTDEAITERTAVAASTDKVISEITTVIPSTDKAVTERTAVFASIDKAISERTAVVPSTDEAITKRTAVAPLVDEAISERRAVIASIDEAITNRTIVAGSADEAISESSAVVSSIDEARTEKDFAAEVEMVSSGLPSETKRVKTDVDQKKLRVESISSDKVLMEEATEQASSNEVECKAADDVVMESITTELVASEESLTEETASAYESISDKAASIDEVRNEEIGQLDKTVIKERDPERVQQEEHINEQNTCKGSEIAFETPAVSGSLNASEGSKLYISKEKEEKGNISSELHTGSMLVDSASESVDVAEMEVAIYSGDSQKCQTVTTHETEEMEIQEPEKETGQGNESHTEESFEGFDRKEPVTVAVGDSQKSEVLKTVDSSKAISGTVVEERTESKSSESVKIMEMDIVTSITSSSSLPESDLKSTVETITQSREVEQEQVLGTTDSSRQATPLRKSRRLSSKFTPTTPVTPRRSRKLSGADATTPINRPIQLKEMVTRSGRKIGQVPTPLTKSKTAVALSLVTPGKKSTKAAATAEEVQKISQQLELSPATDASSTLHVSRAPLLTPPSSPAGGHTRKQQRKASEEEEKPASVTPIVKSPSRYSTRRSVANELQKTGEEKLEIATPVRAKTSGTPSKKSPSRRATRTSTVVELLTNVEEKGKMSTPVKDETSVTASEIQSIREKEKETDTPVKSTTSDTGTVKSPSRRSRRKSAADEMLSKIEEKEEMATPVKSQTDVIVSEKSPSRYSTRRSLIGELPQATDTKEETSVLSKTTISVTPRKKSPRRSTRRSIGNESLDTISEEDENKMPDKASSSVTPKKSPRRSTRRRSIVSESLQTIEEERESLTGEEKKTKGKSTPSRDETTRPLQITPAKPLITPIKETPLKSTPTKTTPTRTRRRSTRQTQASESLATISEDSEVFTTITSELVEGDILTKKVQDSLHEEVSESGPKKTPSRKRRYSLSDNIQADSSNIKSARKRHQSATSEEKLDVRLTSPSQETTEQRNELGRSTPKRGRGRPRKLLRSEAEVQSEDPLLVKTTSVAVLHDASQSSPSRMSTRSSRSSTSSPLTSVKDSESSAEEERPLKKLTYSRVSAKANKSKSRQSLISEETTIDRRKSRRLTIGSTTLSVSSDLHGHKVGRNPSRKSISSVKLYTDLDNKDLSPLTPDLTNRRRIKISKDTSSPILITESAHKEEEEELKEEEEVDEQQEEMSLETAVAGLEEEPAEQESPDVPRLLLKRGKKPKKDRRSRLSLVPLSKERKSLLPRWSVQSLRISSESSQEQDDSLVTTSTKRSIRKSSYGLSSGDTTVVQIETKEEVGESSVVNVLSGTEDDNNEDGNKNEAPVNTDKAESSEVVERKSSETDEKEQSVPQFTFSKPKPVSSRRARALESLTSEAVEFLFSPPRPEGRIMKHQSKIEDSKSSSDESEREKEKTISSSQERRK